MGFEALLGNNRLKENLQESLRRNRISHCYLLTGPAGSGKHTLARLLSAAILCRQPHSPCLTCPSCRKVLAGTHPDVIVMDDPEKKTVSVDLVRQAIADVYIRPNEGSHKLYLFPRAQDMLPAAQNALLKILEEPPAYGVFILLADAPQKLLPTVRSRCTELALTALPEELLRKALQDSFPDAEEGAVSAAISRSGGFFGQAKALLEDGVSLSPQTQAFAKSFAARDTYGLLQVLVPMEKWKRDQLIPVLVQWLTLLENALVCRSGLGTVSQPAQAISTSRSSQELMAATAQLQKAIEYTQGNISVAAVCGYLAWALR